jgi:hypothetical protein
VGAGAIQRRVKHERAPRLLPGGGRTIVIVENAADRENADLAPDTLGGDAAAFLGAHDVEGIASVVI